MRVILVEDQALLRAGLAGLFRDAGHEVVASLSDCQGLEDAVRHGAPHVVVLDVRLPPSFTDEGARAAAGLKSAWPAVGVLLLSQHIETAHSVELAGRGGFGYLLKDRVLEIDDFLESVRRVGRGGSAIDPVVIAQLVGRSRGDDDPLGELTPREREVLGLMAEGLSNGGICRRLFLSPKTVETHVNGIFGKLGLAPAPDDHRRVLAVLAFLNA